MTVLFNGEVKEYEIKETLNVFEKARFVEVVTDMIAPTENTLHTTMKDFAFNVTLVSMFTTLFDDDEFDNDEFDNDMLFLEFVETTDVVDRIKYAIGDDLLMELDKSIYYAVKAKTGVNINGFDYELGSVVKSIINSAISMKDIAKDGEFEKFLERFSKEDLDAKKIVEEYFKSKEVNEQFK